MTYLKCHSTVNEWQVLKSLLKILWKFQKKLQNSDRVWKQSMHLRRTIHVFWMFFDESSLFSGYD